jgi:hypothetical protein
MQDSIGNSLDWINQMRGHVGQTCQLSRRENYVCIFKIKGEMALKKRMTRRAREVGILSR